MKRYEHGISRRAAPRAAVALVPLLVLLAAGRGSAEAVPPLEPYPVNLRIADEVKTAGPSLVQDFGESLPKAVKGNPAPRTLANAGRFVKWGGLYVLGPILVNEALNWYLNQAQEAINYPKTKEWWDSAQGPYNQFPGEETSGVYKINHTDRTHICSKSTNPRVDFYSAYRQVSYNGDVKEYNRVFMAVNPTNYNYTDERTIGQACGPQLKLAEAAQQNPQIKNEVADMVSRYVKDNPDKVRPTLSPVPNINQLGDNPFADPTLDTDGDGATDAEEADAKTDPNDPNSRPYQDPDEIVSKKTRTIKNPDGSTTLETVITYADGTSKTTRVTTSTTTETNPDGSKTVTTTIKTEVTGRDGKTVTTTRTDTEEIPAPDPAPEPPTEEAPCLAAGGTWNAETLTCSVPPPAEPPPGDVTFQDPDPFKLPNFAPLRQQWQKGMQDVSTAAAQKFPFGLGNPASRLTVSTGAGEGSPCPPVTLEMVAYQDTHIPMTLDVCATPGADLAHNILRPLVGWLLTGLTIMGCARLAALS